MRFSLLFLVRWIARDHPCSLALRNILRLAVFGTVRLSPGVSNDRHFFKGLIACLPWFVHVHDRRGFFQRYSAVYRFGLEMLMAGIDLIIALHTDMFRHL